MSFRVLKLAKRPKDRFRESSRGMIPSGSTLIPTPLLSLRKSGPLMQQNRSVSKVQKTTGLSDSRSDRLSGGGQFAPSSAIPLLTQGFASAGVADAISGAVRT